MGRLTLRKFKTKTCHKEFFITPTVGIIKYSAYEEYGKVKRYIRLGFAWLHFRTSVIIWEGKIHE